MTSHPGPDDHSPAQDSTGAPLPHHHVVCHSVEDMARVVAALKAENLPVSVSLDLNRPE